MIFAELLKQTNEEWTIKEKARKIYQLLGQSISYDNRFEYSNDLELLRQIYYRDVNIDIDESPCLVCNSSNKVFKDLLNRLGIRAKLIYKPSAVQRKIDVKDVALVFWDEDGNKYYTNIIGDIFNCKYGLRTNYFGTDKNVYQDAQDVTVISQEELRNIDIKTGSIRNDYNNAFFQILAEEVKDTNRFKKFLASEGFDVRSLTRDDILKLKIDYLTKLISFRDKTAGPEELKIFYKKLFCSSALDNFESNKFSTYEFYKEENGSLKLISCIEIDLHGNIVYYVYNEERQTYIQVTNEELLERIQGFRERKGKLPKILNNEKEIGEE